MERNNFFCTEAYVLRNGQCGDVLKHYMRSSPYWPFPPRPDASFLLLERLTNSCRSALWCTEMCVRDVVGFWVCISEAGEGCMRADGCCEHVRVWTGKDCCT